MSNYYNEIDPAMAAWLRSLIDAGLIPPGEVDTRSIKEVTHSDLKGRTQCHFFAGIGGWPLALRLAGWRDDRRVWTGSNTRSQEVGDPWGFANWNGRMPDPHLLGDGVSRRVAKSIVGGFGNAIIPQLAAEFICAADAALT